MNYTKSIGDVTELKCLAAFIGTGFDCSIPYGNSSKYDIIVDTEDELLKIQCKSSRNVSNHGNIDENAFTFSTVAQTVNTKKVTTYAYDSNKIDYFATEFNNNIYLIPVDECKGSSKTLRLKPPLNNIPYNKAEDYLIENILGHKIPKSFIRDKENYLNRNIFYKNGSPTIHYCTCCKTAVVSKKD